MEVFCRFSRKRWRKIIYNNHMVAEEILELVKDGTIEPDEVEDFQALSEEVQQLVVDGDLDMSDVTNL